MISDLAASTDIGVWATISLLAAMGVFALVVLRIVGLKPSTVETLSRLPLHDGEPLHDGKPVDDGKSLDKIASADQSRAR